MWEEEEKEDQKGPKFNTTYRVWTWTYSRFPTVVYKVLEALEGVPEIHAAFY